jgi:hypothetical protein
VTTIRATVANMHRAPEGTVAISPVTGEEYSATPGDYWDAPLNYCLTDSDGNEMILVREVHDYVDVVLTEE